MNGFLQNKEFSNFDYIIQDIENRAIGTFNFKYPKMEDGWYDFIDRTDIGKK